MDLLKENVDINADMIERLRQELSEVSRQVGEQSLKKGVLEKEVMELRARGNMDPRDSKLIEELSVKKVDAKALKEGVESFSGVSDPVQVDNCLSMKIEGVAFEMIFDRSSKAVTDIKLISGEFRHDINKILQNCNSIPPAQQLRFAIHSLKSSIHASRMLKKDIADLKSYCIVKQSNDSVFLTMRNGLTAEVATNNSYSQSPASACLVSLVGVGGWSAEELERIRRMVNDACFNNIRDIFNMLQVMS